jgi:hypothetical protein
MRGSNELLLTRCRAFVDWFYDKAVRGLLGEGRRSRAMKPSGSPKPPVLLRARDRKAAPKRDLSFIRFRP